MNRYTMDEFMGLRTGLTAEEIEALAEYAGVALFNLDLTSGSIALNRNTANLTGYEPGDLPHSENTKMLLTFEEDRALVGSAMQKLFAGESERYQLEYRMRRRDGSIVSISESAIVAERDQNGKPLRLSGMALDLSRLRWAEEKARAMDAENRRLAQNFGENDLADQNRMLRAANAAAAMIIGGFHQDYETVLRQALQILGESIQADRAYILRNFIQDGKTGFFPRAEWAKNLHSGREPTSRWFYEDLFPQWQSRLTQEKAMVIQRAQDLPEAVAALPGVKDVKTILLSPIFLNGDFWGMVGFDNCTTDRLYTPVEGEIMTSGAMVVASSIGRNETFGKLNEAREEAMASTRAKGEFLSRMSHEIRTPMNAIIGMTTIAKKSGDPQRIRYCLDKVDASSRQLLGIINDVLDMSKIDSGKFEIMAGPFDFEKMIQNVINVVQVKLDEQHQQLRVDFGSVLTRMMISDELRLSQVMINLLTNAVKFTPVGGDISIKIAEEPLTEHRSRLRVEIADNGIGIEEEKQKNLFESFEQADGSITRKYGGTGLGLAICKKIINLMGGDIWVESQPGKGATFIFEIETGWGDQLVPALQNSLPTHLKILVVDDAEDVREYFHNILTGFHLDCHTAANGNEALAAVKESVAQGAPYDMAFIDWNMPGMNGGKTAQELRALLPGDTVVVMISVSDWADIEQDARGYGVNHFLAKPVLPSALYNTIVDLTGNALVTDGTREAPPCNWAGRTILLAEDIEINREIISSILEDTCVTIECAENGAQAVEMFAQNAGRYDLILMDVQMPILDGIGATQRIRSMDLPQAKEIPILAMTANAFKEDAQICLAAGMNGHLPKPLDVNELLQTLSDYLDP